MTGTTATCSADATDSPQAPDSPTTASLESVLRRLKMEDDCDDPQPGRASAFAQESNINTQLGGKRRNNAPSITYSLTSGGGDNGRQDSGSTYSRAYSWDDPAMVSPPTNQSTKSFTSNGSRGNWNGKKQQRGDNGNYQRGKNTSRAETPPSTISHFSVSSSDDIVIPKANPGENALSKNCTFVSAPLAPPKVEPNFHPGCELGQPVQLAELFIGQINFDFSPAGLCEALMKLAGASQPIVTRLKPGPKPTCAFVTVLAQYKEPLLALSKKMLCDHKGIWVAHSAAAENAIHSVADRRRQLHTPGIPNRPVVVEPVHERARNQNANRGGARLGNREGGSYAPPPYFPQAFANPYAGANAAAGFAMPQQWTSQLPWATAGGASGFQGGYQPGMPFTPQQQQPFTLHQEQFPVTQQQQTQNSGTSPSGSTATAQEIAERAVSRSVCACGRPHVIAQTREECLCATCRRRLPPFTYVRSCPNCVSRICTLCVEEAMSTSTTSSH